MNTQNVKTFDFSSIGLGSVLKQNRLVVPLYQREYSWESDTVEQLYNDLAVAKLESADYFLGTIVTIPSSSEPVLEVVDGQQRLTTTAILLAAIRDHIFSTGSGNMVVESIENEFLSTIDRRVGDRTPRLKLNIDDNAFFVELIKQGQLASPPIAQKESHHRLIAASKIAIKTVKNMVSQFQAIHHIDVLNDWLEFLESKATVILLTAPDSAHAFRMFETLNDRGLKTSQADLVKSYLFGQTNKRIIEAQAKWSSMKNMLEEIDDDNRSINFLRHVLISTKQLTRSDDVYSTVQTSVKGETNSIAFLSDLEKLSGIYVATHRSDAEYWNDYSKEAIDALKVINKFNIRPFRPLLLSIALKFSQNETEFAFKFLVSLSVRLLIAYNTRSGAIEESIGNAALQVCNGSIKTAADIKKFLKRITPDDQTFEVAFKTATVSKSDYARYYLRTLESIKTKKIEPWVVLNEDASEITLEHILPKKPNQGEWENFDSDNLTRHSRRIGNMCLLQKSTNSNVRSAEFSDKVELYKKSPYGLTKMIGSESEWGPTQIELRQLELAKIAVKAWPI